MTCRRVRATLQEYREPTTVTLRKKSKNDNIDIDSDDTMQIHLLHLNNGIIYKYQNYPSAQRTILSMVKGKAYVHQ